MADAVRDSPAHHYVVRSAGLLRLERSGREVDPERSDLAVQRGTCDAEILGGPVLIAAGCPESSSYGIGLDVFETNKFSPRRARDDIGG